MGSGITRDLGVFIDRARLSEGGEMRVSRDGGELVNKGTLGQKIASFFTNIGQALGLVKETKGNEASQRQEKALDGFRQALSREFTPTIANDVLSNHQGKLTGKFVLETATRAQEMARGVENHNRSIGTVEHQQKAMESLNIKSLTSEQRFSFVDHFEALQSKALEGNLHKLEGKELAGMAEDAMRLAVGRPTARSEPALNAIQSHVDEMKGSLERNYKANGGREFDKLWSKVESQLHSTANSILDGPKELMGSNARGKLTEAMGKVMDDRLLDPGAKRDALNHFTNCVIGISAHHRNIEI